MTMSARDKHFLGLLRKADAVRIYVSWLERYVKISKAEATTMVSMGVDYSARIDGGWLYIDPAS